MLKLGRYWPWKTVSSHLKQLGSEETRSMFAYVGTLIRQVWGNVPQFVMNATETLHGDLILRQVTEWVLINEVEESANQIQKWMEILPHPEN